MKYLSCFFILFMCCMMFSCTQDELNQENDLIEATVEARAAAACSATGCATPLIQYVWVYQKPGTCKTRLDIEAIMGTGSYCVQDAFGNVIDCGQYNGSGSFFFVPPGGPFTVTVERVTPLGTQCWTETFSC